MALRRMFSKEVTNSDEFLDMPLTSQALYFHLGMNADDDGFVSPKSILRLSGARDDDLKVLITKGFVIEFRGSVIVITHWKTNNEIKKDRYKKTIYQEHLSVLGLDNGKYNMSPECLQNVSNLDTQVRLGKVSIDISSKEDTDSQDEISPSLEDGIKHKSIEPSSAAKTAAQGQKPDSNYVLCDKLIKILKDTISVKALLKPMSVALTIDTGDNILLGATNYMAQLKDDKYKKGAMNFLREEFWKKYVIKEKPALLKKYEIDIESASIRFYDKEEYIVDGVRERIQYRYLTPDQAVEFKQLYKDYYGYEYEGKLSVCMDKDARLKYFNY